LADKLKLFLLVVLMGTVAMIAVAIAIHQMYQTAIKENLAQLQESVRIQAGTLEIIAKHEILKSSDHQSETTLLLIRQIFENYYSRIVDSDIRNEIVLARLDGDTIRIMFSHTQTHPGVPASIPLSSGTDTPVQLAAKGLSGKMVGRDHEGTLVLAAYEPVKVLNLGIVSKIDLRNVRTPFIRSGIIILAISLIILVGTALVFRQVSMPMILRLKTYSTDLEKLVEQRTEEFRASENKFRGIFENAPFTIFTADIMGNVFDINHAGIEFFKYPADDTQTVPFSVRSVVAEDEWNVIHQHLTKPGGFSNILMNIRRGESEFSQCYVSASKLNMKSDEKPLFLFVLRDTSDEIALTENRWKNEVLDKFKLATYSMMINCSEGSQDELNSDQCIRDLARTCYENIPVRSVVFFQLDQETGKLRNTGLSANSYDLNSMKEAYPEFNHQKMFDIGGNEAMENIMRQNETVILDKFSQLGAGTGIGRHAAVYDGCRIALVPIHPYGENWGLVGIIYEKYMPIENLLGDIKFQFEISIRHLNDIMNQNRDRRRIEELASFPLHNPAPVISCDLQGNVLYMNDACREAVKAQGADPENISVLLRPECIKAAVAWFRKEKKQFIQEDQVGNLSLLWKANLIPSIYQIHFYATDISEIKGIQKSLEIAKNKAESADKLKTHFLQNISHEIRTPLHAIMGYSDLISKTASDRLESDELFFLGAIQSGGTRLLRTMHEILDISVLNAGDYEPMFEIFNIQDLLKKVREVFKSDADKKFLDFNVKSLAAGTMVRYDFNGLFYALSHLVENSIKYTEQGFVRLSIQEKGDQLTLAVADSGIGMDEKYMEIMYNPFTQESDGIGKKFQGIGLGLSITKQYLDINKIPITVESKKGHGTTIQLRLRKWNEIDDV